MPHKLLLGFKQNPTTGDDYIDLGGGLNDANNKGYHLKSYLEGDVTTDEYGHMVRPLTIVFDIDDATIGGAMAKYHAIDRYIQQTRIYLKPFKGNWAATTDGTWYSGFCASLTFQPVGATRPIYWDVLGGTLARDETYLGENLIGGVLENVTLTLMVRYAARGDLETLCNLVTAGSGEPPFNPQDTTLNAGWIFTTPSVWSLETGPGKYGLNALKWVGVASTTATTNENTDIYYYVGTTPTLFPFVAGAIWLKASGVTGTITVTIESYNGSAWSTLATIASGVGNLANWTYYKIENVVPPAGAVKLRVKIVTPTSGTVYFDGVAIWRSATVPANGEYFTGGGLAGFPSTYLYGAVGDIEAPCLLHIGTTINGPGATGAAYTPKNVIIGAREYNYTTTGRDSIPGMAARFANGTTNAALLWGKNGQTSTGTAALAQFLLQSITALPPIVSVPRKYRLVIAYNSNIAITSALVFMEHSSTLSASGSKSFTKTIPSTGGADKLFDLGDIIYPTPDSAVQDQPYTGLSSIENGLNHFQFAFPSGAYTIKFNGYLLIPTEYFVYMYQDAFSGTAAVSTMGDPENGSVKALQGGSVYSAANLGDINLTSINNSDTLQIVPGNMQFEILILSAQDATYTDLYTYDATLPYTPTLVYQPRYLSGGM